jgi:Phosducin
MAATWATSGPKFDSKAERERQSEASKKTKDDEEEDFGLDDDEEDFLAAYKAKRMQELKGGSSATAAAPSSTYSSASLSALSSRAAAASASAAEAALPRYDDEEEGWPIEITSQDQFVSTLDAIDKRSFAVVLMWERFIPAAAHLKARVWPALSSLHPHVAFLSAISSCLSESIDVIGLPAIVIYKGGQTVEAIVRAHDVIGDEKPALEDVTELLRSYGVRPLSSIQPEKGGGGRR